MKLFGRLFLSLLLILFFLLTERSSVYAVTLAVPAQYATIQAALNAANTGDTIKVAAGTYQGATIIKQVILEAEIYDRTNPKNNKTRINGQILIQGGSWAWNQGPVIRGFYIVGLDPVRGIKTAYTLEYSFIEAAGQGNDGISFESAGGIIRGNHVDPGGDDNIDVDSQTMDILIEDNYLKNANQDGVEVRQQPSSISSGVTLTMRNNRIENSGQDGLQIMDYGNFTNRRYILERNLFIGAGFKASGAGIGIMAADVTTENFSAAPMPEPLYAINNTFVNGDAGISGGANLIAINNIFSGNSVFDLKNVNGKSKVMNSLFSTAPKLQGTNNLDFQATKTGNPLLDASYGLQAGSPAINAGRTTYQHTYTYDGSGGGSAQTITESVINLSANQYTGSAPDLGWKESGMIGPTLPPVTLTNQPSITVQPTLSSGPTPTTQPGATQLGLTLFLHGIGRGGDNVSPGTFGNMNPLHPQHTATLELFDASNQSLGIKQGTLTFNNTEGSFKGTIDAGMLQSGVYTARVNVPFYLRKLYPGIVSITGGSLNQLPALSLVAGDSNNDNSLSILDYNIILDCYSDLSAPRNCTDAQKMLSADLTDDGAVNQFDYNLFLRELSVQGGDGGGGTPAPSSPVSPSIRPTNTPVLSQGPTLPPGGDRITYTSTTEDFGNPERGFMKQANIWLDQPFSAAKISAALPSDRLVWVYFHLENYRDPRDGKGVTLTNYQGKLLEPVGSGKGLDTVQKTFNEARNKGLKLVIRFLYVGYSGIGSTGDPKTAEPDMPIDWVAQHINQLKSVVDANKDVVAATQVGWVGYWGEWHSSKYLGDLTNRKKVIDAMLAGMPKDRMVQLRYPRYKQLWYGGPVTYANAFNQSDVARLALHDDAFLKDDTDDGTFKSSTGGTKITNYCDGFSAGEPACWRDYFYKDSRFVAAGGEAGTHSSTPSTLQMCPNALTQLNGMHFSFLHNGYAKVVLDTWVNQGCMPEIRRRLGYRLELKEATIPKTVSRGKAYGMQIILRNSGFASLYNSRPAYLVLLSPQRRYEIALSAVDPRRWEAGSDHTVNATVTIPATVPQGSYKLGFFLPDESSALKNNPAYSVRFANTGVWDAATGINILTPSLTVAP